MRLVIGPAHKNPDSPTNIQLKRNNQILPLTLRYASPTHVWLGYFLRYIFMTWLVGSKISHFLPRSTLFILLFIPSKNDSYLIISWVTLPVSLLYSFLWSPSSTLWSPSTLSSPWHLDEYLASTSLKELQASSPRLVHFGEALESFTSRTVLFLSFKTRCLRLLPLSNNQFYNSCKYLLSSLHNLRKPFPYV